VKNVTKPRSWDKVARYSHMIYSTFSGPNSTINSKNLPMNHETCRLIFQKHFRIYSCITISSLFIAHLQHKFHFHKNTSHFPHTPPNEPPPTHTNSQNGIHVLSPRNLRGGLLQTQRPRRHSPLLYTLHNRHNRVVLVRSSFSLPSSFLPSSPHFLANASNLT
jgi:hypothetical protein